MNLAELGEAFRHARFAAHKTQQQVEKLSGVTRARISRFETAQLPTLGAAEMLSLFEALGLELYARPIGPGLTLDDVPAEQQTAALSVKKTASARATSASEMICFCYRSFIPEQSTRLRPWFSTWTLSKRSRWSTALLRSDDGHCPSAPGPGLPTKSWVEEALKDTATRSPRSSLAAVEN